MCWWSSTYAVFQAACSPTCFAPQTLPGGACRFGGHSDRGAVPRGMLDRDAAEAIRTHLTRRMACRSAGDEGDLSRPLPSGGSENDALSATDAHSGAWRTHLSQNLYLASRRPERASRNTRLPSGHGLGDKKVRVP